MEIVQSTVKKLTLTSLEALDPVTIFIEDYEPGKGKITFECFGKSWSYYWGGMGGRDIAKFFLSCNTAYLVNCLWDHSQESSELDFDGLTLIIRESVIELRREDLIDSSTAREMYNIEDWQTYAPQHCYDTWTCPAFVEESDFERFGLYDMNIPTKSTSDYCYLARLVEAISLAFKQLDKQA